jgi:hypothetical protein
MRQFCGDAIAASCIKHCGLSLSGCSAVQAIRLRRSPGDHLPISTFDLG